MNIKWSDEHPNNEQSNVGSQQELQAAVGKEPATCVTEVHEVHFHGRIFDSISMIWSAVLLILVFGSSRDLARGLTR